MKAPFLKKGFEIGEDELFGMKTGAFFISPVGNVNTNPPELMELDDVLAQLLQYRLMGVEMFLMRGHEPASMASFIVAPLAVVSDHGPVRVYTNGLRPSAMGKIKEMVSGFKVDVKIPLKSKYTAAEVARYEEFVGPGVVAYGKFLMETVEMADGMELTVFNCSTFQSLSLDERTEMQCLMGKCRSTFSMGERLFKGGVWRD